MRTTLWTLVALLALATALPAATYVVNGSHPAASDTHPGTAAQPLKTIASGVKKLAPGDTLVIAGGTYREVVWPKVKGTPEKPITIKALDGQRVVLTGAVKITGWKKCAAADAPGSANAEKLFMVDLDWTPARLFEGSKQMTVARTPNAGWWGITKGLSLSKFTDKVHLTQESPNAWDGWTVALLEQAGGGMNHIPVKAFDPETHAITLARDYSRYRKIINEKRDRYYMENHLSTLDGPGQYVLQPLDGGGTRLFAWPSKLDDGGLPVIEAPKLGTLFHLTHQANLVIDGLEVCYGTSHGLGMGRSGSPVNVTLQNCYVHDNAGYGIEMRKPIRCTIRRNIIRGNSNGVVLGGALDTVIEENDIGWNHGDGLDAPGGTRNLIIRRNYIHDHYQWGHPDNIQFWSDVRNVTIRDNVMLNGGQTMMSDGMKGTKLINNMWVGSRAVSMICGGDDWEIVGNTVCASGPMPTNLSGRMFTLKNNIFSPLHGTPLYGMSDPDTFVADYNILWAGPDYKKTLVIKGRWADSAASLDQIREKFGQEMHGKVVDPKFRNAPKAFTVTDYSGVQNCTTTKFVFRGKAAGMFAVGDNVELDFDGVPRKVTEVGGDYIVVDAPLAEPPLTMQSVANWGEKTDFTWDLRLADDSPAKAAGEGGRDIGCTLDIQAYMRGDFNGDGRRDLPPAPKD